MTEREKELEGEVISLQTQLTVLAGACMAVVSTNDVGRLQDVLFMMKYLHGIPLFKQWMDDQREKEK